MQQKDTSAMSNVLNKSVAIQGTLPFQQATAPKSNQIEYANISLNNAFAKKKDEFYTQYEDVEKEMSLHEEVFVSKNVFCNCDDPYESAFFKFFVLNFNRLGLSTLSSTCYTGFPKLRGSYLIGENKNAYKAVVNKVVDETILLPDGSINWKELFKTADNRIELLSGNGDFRSNECIELLKSCDIVATNPPFSLFREYVRLLQKHNKQFIILGNMNAATTREIFPLFKNNQVWYGDSIRSGDRKFFVPNNYPLNAACCGIDKDGQRFIRVKGVRWFTNIKFSSPAKRLKLKKLYNEAEYPYYDNYDAIEVCRTLNIPLDYKGIMGVPITFLDKYCPEQFEIIMLANGNARTNVSKQTLSKVKYIKHPKDKGGVCMLNGKRVYARILIRNRFT